MNERLSRFARRVAEWVGHPYAFPLVVVACILWAHFGPGTDTENFAVSLYTVLLLHLLQHSYNREIQALHLKVDELLKVTPARNELRALEEKPEAEIKRERQSR